MSKYSLILQLDVFRSIVGVINYSEGSFYLEKTQVVFGDLASQVEYEFFNQGKIDTDVQEGLNNILVCSDDILNTSVIKHCDGFFDIKARLMNPDTYCKALKSMEAKELTKFIDGLYIQISNVIDYAEDSAFLSFRSLNKDGKSLSKPKKMKVPNELLVNIIPTSADIDQLLSIQKLSIIRKNDEVLPQEIYHAIEYLRKNTFDKDYLLTLLEELFPEHQTEILRLVLDIWLQRNPTSSISVKSTSSFKRTKAYSEIATLVCSLDKEIILPITLNEYLLIHRYTPEIILCDDQLIYCYLSLTEHCNRLEDFAWARF